MNLTDTIALICERVGVSEQDFYSTKRQRNIVDARKIITYNLYKLGYRSSYIGRHFNRNHATIIEQFNQYLNLYATDKKFKALADRIDFIQQQPRIKQRMEVIY